MAPQLEDIRKKLIEFGADPKAAEKEIKNYDIEHLRNAPDELLKFVALLANFHDFLDNMEKYKRKRVVFTLAEPLHDLLKHLAEDIRDPDGRSYPLSYFVEDMLIWVLSNYDRFIEFFSETYDINMGGEASEQE